MIRNIGFSVHCIGDLSADAKGQTKALAVFGGGFSTFFGKDGYRGIDFGYDRIFKQIHLYHQFDCNVLIKKIQEQNIKKYQKG